MRYSKIENDNYLIRLEKGEKIIESLTKFCERSNINNAWFTAIGSVESPTLAHYMVGTKKYTEKSLDGIFEVTSLAGNVALFEGRPLLHAHITLSDDDMHAFGGHLVEAKVSATLEILFNKMDSGKTKLYNEEIGLKLFDLDEQIY